MSDLQLTVQAASLDYGFFITTTNNDVDLSDGTWNSEALYWETTEANVGGTAADSDQVVVADVTGLVVGQICASRGQITFNEAKKPAFIVNSQNLDGVKRRIL